MEFKFLRRKTKVILIIVIVGFVLTVLAGCGISPGPYQRGYGNRIYHNNADEYGAGYGNYGNAYAVPRFNPGGRGYGPMMGYDYYGSGYCW
jgi:hypothetical protein